MLGQVCVHPVAVWKKQFQKAVMLSKLYDSHFIKAKFIEDVLISFLPDRRCRKKWCWVFSPRGRTVPGDQTIKGEWTWEEQYRGALMIYKTKKIQSETDFFNDYYCMLS